MLGRNYSSKTNDLGSVYFFRLLISVGGTKHLASYFCAFLWGRKLLLDNYVHPQGYPELISWLMAGKASPLPNVTSDVSPVKHCTIYFFLLLLPVTI
jgi:hypothetical protein